jgi:ribosome biogenesis GTPase
VIEYGIVTRNDGPRFWVEIDGGEVPCGLRGKLKKRQLRATSILAVGDKVACERQSDGSGMIEEVLPRRSELSRPGFHGYTHVMAANVDQLVIVQAAQQPTFRMGLVDRFLATASRGRMGALVVVNKCDLEHPATIASWVAPLTAVGIEVILASTVTGQGVAALRDRLDGRISVLAGQSGVGKSSLVNAVFAQTQAHTTAISDWNQKGRHTTTSSRLYPLPGGGYLADTPGIRELALFDDDEAAVDEAFPEITSAAVGCKFRDCTHDHEPGCAVKRLVDNGTIDAGRYRSFLRMK